MSDLRSKRLNEQIKGVTGIGFNLGAALIATVAARVTAASKPDLVAAFWLIGALVLIWLSAKGLSLLESED